MRALMQVVLLGMAIAGVARAAPADRPDEDELFGGSPVAPDAGTPAPSPVPAHPGETESSRPPRPPATPPPYQPVKKARGKRARAMEDVLNQIGAFNNVPPPASAPALPPAHPASPASPAAPAAAVSTAPVSPAPEETKPFNPVHFDSREMEALSGKAPNDAFETGTVRDDPLRIGGQFYLRGIMQSNDRNTFSQSTFSVPTLLDVFLDGRPNDHLRAMVVGRLIYDPLLSTATFPGTTASATATPNPAVVLDRAWLSFDIARSVFVTVGRERIRWGTAHVWNPTDFLASVRRDPLATFDARVGVSMVKVHVPVESLGWNFYAIGVFEQTQRPGGLGAGGSGSTTLPQSASDNAYGTAGVGNALRDIGGAFRGEFVFGHTEIGIDGLAQRGKEPRLGVDISSAVGPVDVFAEAALQRGTDVQRYRPAANPDPTQGLNGLVEPYGGKEAVVQASGGLSYQVVINDQDSLVLGAEYYFNSGGYDSSAVYPYLLFTGNYTPFYTGKHYAALTASLPSPGNWENVTFSLSTLANLSDLSFISRLDFSIRVLSYLTVEAFVAGHYGHRGGEFRLGFDTPAGVLNGQPIPAITVPAPIVDVGVGLRLSI